MFGAIRIVFILCSLFLKSDPNCNTGISFHSVMQNIFITFEAGSPQYLHTRKPLHLHERVDIQYFIDLQTIIRAKRGAKVQNYIQNTKLYYRF